MSWRKPCNIWEYPLYLCTSPQNCDTQEYRVVTSSSRYPKKRTLHLTEDFCLIVSKMRKICNDEGRKKAFEDYSSDLHNPHPWHKKCNVVLSTSDCAVSLFLWCWFNPTPPFHGSQNLYPGGAVAHHCRNTRSGEDDILYTPDPNEANIADSIAISVFVWYVGWNWQNQKQIQRTM